MQYIIYAMVKNPIITETIRLNRLRWFGHVQRMEENRIPKKVLCMNLETARLRWKDKVRVDGRLVGGKRVEGKGNNREEWKKLPRTARNRRILHMPMELMLWKCNTYIFTMWWIYRGLYLEFYLGLNTALMTLWWSFKTETCSYF